MTALKWNRDEQSFYQSRLGVLHTARLSTFALFVREGKSKARWGVMLAELTAATGDAENVDSAKQAAEKWLRGFLHDLLRQLRDPEVS